MKKKTIFYIDGFNVYYGLKDANKYEKYGDYRWLDYQKLAENTIKPSQQLELIKYFTARIRNNKPKEKRQGDYLEALGLQSKMRIYYGNYQIKKSFDKTLKQYFSYPIEKRTDVNIATQILIDAFQGNFEIAYIMTGDSDLYPALEAIRNHFPSLTLVACFAPRRSSSDLKAICQECTYLKERVFKNSLLPDTLTKSDGYVIRRPVNWY